MPKKLTKNRDFEAMANEIGCSVEDLKSLAKKSIEQTFLSMLASKVGCDDEDIVVMVKDVRSHSCKSQQGKFYVYFKKETIATFDLVTLPGCCGVLVSTGAYVYPKYRSRGIGNLLNQMRQKVALEWGYSVMICTDVIDNKPQQHILNKQGWKKIFDFTNNRTSNRVSMHVVELEGDIPLGFNLKNKTD